MIEVSWIVSLECNGGHFFVPDGTDTSEIARMVEANVQKSIYSRWSPSPAAPKDVVS